MLRWILSSSLLIAIVMALRYALRGRLIPQLQYARWLPVLVRLLIPFSFEGTEFSVMNAVERAPLVQISELLNGIDHIVYSYSGNIEGYYSDDYMRVQPTILAENASEDDYERINSVIGAREILNTIWE